MAGTTQKDFINYLILQRVALKTRKAYINAVTLFAFAADPKPFAGPKQALNYLGRYTHRIAISNHRIKAIENNKVVFSYKDRSDGNLCKDMELPALEFIRRFLLHVLPKRFMKIRYYGFLANIGKQKAVLLIRCLIGKYVEVTIFTGERYCV